MMLSAYRNSKKQGDAGLGAAIGYFTYLGYGVLVPLTDSQEYDLIVDDGDRFIRVQVKTATKKAKSGGWKVGLRTIGGNRSGTGKCKKLDTTKVDVIFVLTPESRHLIPVEHLGGRSALILGERYSDFRV